MSAENAPNLVRALSEAQNYSSIKPDRGLPPNISGSWLRVAREMFGRSAANPGYMKVDPADPSSQNGLTYALIQIGAGYFGGRIEGAKLHDQTLAAQYLGKDRKGHDVFSFDIHREHKDSAALPMVLKGYLKIVDKNTLETLTTGVEGGDPSKGDPPPAFREWSRLRKLPQPAP